MTTMAETYPYSRVELTILCANLVGASAKPDACCRLHARRSPQQPWELIGRTDIVQGTQPVFTTPIVVDYYFDSLQYLRFEVLDVDGAPSTSGAVKGDLLGELECTLSQIVGARSCTLIAPLASSHTVSAAIKVMAEEAKEVKGQLELLLIGYDLANRAGWFGTNQAYYVLSKARGDGAWAPCARSVVVRGGANPNWPFLRVPMQRLCNGDLNRPLRLEVRHDEGGEAFANVGHATVTAGQLQTANFSVALSHPRGKDKPVGTCAVQLTRVVEEPTFLAYVAGGLELRLMVGIDFSYFYGADEPGGQSKLRKVDSADAGAPNPYETVLRTLGAVLAPYDADGKIPCYGFGGVLPGGVSSQQFALNGDEAKPACKGVDAMVAAYREALARVAPSNRTLMAPLIDQAAREADMAEKRRMSGEPLQYTVLLLLTGGSISSQRIDVELTHKAVAAASLQGMSVVFVGCGGADFEALKSMDGTKLRGGIRDCAHFVRAPDAAAAGGAEAELLAAQQLAREALQELPRQVVEHFTAKWMPPPPPLPRPKGMAVDPTRF